MRAFLTAAEMRALEEEAMAGGNITAEMLMERAGRATVNAMLVEWQAIEWHACRAVVLCGPGRNGGDGFVVARLLKSRGWDVAVWLYGLVESLPPEARAQAERWEALGEIRELGQPISRETIAAVRDSVLAPGAETVVIVVALFGIGLTRPLGDGDSGLDQLLARVLSLATVTRDPGRGLPNIDVKRLAVDLPSGICADSGRRLGPLPVEGSDPQDMGMDLTVAFHRHKLGHVLGDGPLYAGKVTVVDIGLPQQFAWTLHAAQAASASAERLSKARRAEAHKFTHGHALVLGGGPGQGGAARLAARGALRIGAGLVTLLTPPDALAENAARLDAVMLATLPDGAALSARLADPRVTALVIGPALGLGDREAALVAAALDSRRPIVLDADALTLVAGDRALRARLHDRAVLTPHLGEFARLCPDIAARLDAPAERGPAYSKLDAARDAAAEFGCTLLLKGAATVIASAIGLSAINVALHERAAPWLATAGSGDVLAGFIGGLLARGVHPFEAASAAAWLHTECALVKGPGLIAEDLPDALPAVLARIGA